ncbi:hypothetical protein BTA37_25220 [Priestia megaterium]|nr:hypothetical protein BTA37_25220 [Priestia megaterium]
MLVGKIIGQSFPFFQKKHSYELVNQGPRPTSEAAINVKNFGAKGDGVTDDTEAIQNAIDSVNQKVGGTIYFPTGTYTISASIEIKNKNKIKINGDGYSSIIQARGTQNNPIAFPLITVSNNGSSKFVASDLLFQILHSDENLASGIATTGSDKLVDASIKNCWFSQTNIALKGEFVTLNFSSNIVELGKSGGIDIKGDNFRKVIIANNHFFANNKAHIRLHNTSSTKRGMNNISIIGNQFDQGIAPSYIKGEKSKGNGIDLKGISLFTIEGNNFNGYTPSNTKVSGEKQIGHAIKIIDSDNFIIGNNTYSQYKYSAIYLKNNSKFSIEGIVNGFNEAGVSVGNCNDFKVDMIVTNSKIGLSVENSSKFDIKGTYSNNYEHGITIINSSQGVIQASTTDNNLKKLPNRFGVFLSKNTNEVIVLNINPLKKNQISDIALDSSTFNNTVSNLNNFPLKKGAVLDKGIKNKINSNS